MVSLLSPGWLLGLVSLPLIYWLHRFSASGRPVQVSALFLWQSHQATTPAGPQPGPVDRRWRLRALLAAVLVLALCEPLWLTGSARVIEVWIDDSLSMHSVENSNTRLNTGFQQLAHALSRSGAHTAVLHSLGNPALRHELDSNDFRSADRLLDRWTRNPSVVITPPAPVLMTAQHEHWLLTDGASRSLREWHTSAPIRKVINVGNATANVGLTRVAASPAQDRSATARVLIHVANFSPGEQSRTLTITADGQPILADELAIPADSDVSRVYPLPGPLPEQLHITLTPPDSLALDDTLQLDTRPLSPVPVYVDTRCPAPVQVALGTHPRLQLAAAPDNAALDVLCDTDTVATRVPVIRIHRQHAPIQVPGTPAWNTGDSEVPWPRLQNNWLYSDGGQSLPDSHTRVLGTAQTPLITASRTAPPVLDVYMDFNQGQLTQQPEFVSLMDSLLQRALGRPLLGAVVSAGYPAGAGHIAPVPLQPKRTIETDSALTDQAIDLAPYLLLLAILLLAIDTYRGRPPRAQVSALQGDNP